MLLILILSTIERVKVMDKDNNKNMDESDISIYLNQEGNQGVISQDLISIPLNQEGHQQRHGMNDVIALDRTVNNSPLAPCSTLPSSTPFSKRKENTFDSKDYFYGDSPDKRPLQKSNMLLIS